MIGEGQKPTSMVLATVGTPFEARQIVQMLQDRNLPCLLRDQETMFSVGRSGKRSGILVIVRSEDYSQAMHLLEKSKTPGWSRPNLEA